GLSELPGTLKVESLELFCPHGGSICRSAWEEVRRTWWTSAKNTLKCSHNGTWSIAWHRLEGYYGSTGRAFGPQQQYTQPGCAQWPARHRTGRRAGGVLWAGVGGFGR